MSLKTLTRVTPLGLLALGISAEPAGATLPTLHVSASVYDKHTTAGDTFSSHERPTRGGAPIGEDFSRCTGTSAKETITFK
jgi:hypothetical protein